MVKCQDMRIALTVLIILVGISSAGYLRAADLDRAKGLSAHFLPKRVAEADQSKRIKSGFVASTAQTASLPAKDRPVFQSAADLIAYYKTLDPETQRNGIWVVLTNPAAYSKDEVAVLEELKRQSKAQGIPLFIAQGRDLPDGWQRHSAIRTAPHT